MLTQTATVMIRLEEKVVNCFSRYLTNLICGKTDQNYCLLYDSILLLRNNINEEKYIQYFYNNLNCSGNIKLEVIDEKNRILGSTLNVLETSDNSFIWDEIDTPNLKTYSITTDSLQGYNFFYISIPPNTDARVYDSLNNLLLDTSIAGDYEFIYDSTVVTSKGQVNSVYRKKNMYNTINPVNFIVTLL